MGKNKRMTEKELKLLVLKNIIKVSKNHRIYHILRVNWGGGKYNFTPIYFLKSINKYVKISYECRSENPFMKANCIDDILSIMSKMVHHPLSDDMNIFNQESNSKELQIRITQYINNILHSCLEYGVGDMKKMEIIGKEIYELTCKKVFGEDFVDETEDEIPPQLQKMIEMGAMNPEMVAQHFYDNPFIKAIMNGEIADRRIHRRMDDYFTTYASNDEADYPF